MRLEGGQGMWASDREARQKHLGLLEPGTQGSKIKETASVSLKLSELRVVAKLAFQL